MKFKLMLLTLTFAAGAYGGTAVVQRRSLIAPTSASTPSNTISAAGSGLRNCLSNLDVTAQSDYSIRILDGGTTVYALSLSSGSTLIRAWDDSDMCGTSNTAMYVNLSSVSAAGTSRLNYAGYTY